MRTTNIAGDMGGGTGCSNCAFPGRGRVALEHGLHLPNL